MQISFDPAKTERNRLERGLPFEMAAQFNFADALIRPSVRNGELRREAVGYLGDRLHVLCYLAVSGNIRVISLRKANRREAKRNGFTLRR